jgi:hypothetical protein
MIWLSLGCANFKAKPFLHDKHALEKSMYSLKITRKSLGVLETPYIAQPRVYIYPLHAKHWSVGCCLDVNRVLMCQATHVCNCLTA